MYETSTAPNPVAAFEYWVSTAITKGNAPVPVCSPKSSPVGQDFYQSRVIRAVHESLHLRIDCHFFVLVSARRGRKKNQCNHKAQRWTEPYPLHQRDNKRTKKRLFKDFRDTFQTELVVQQEASGITRQNVAGPSAGPTSNSNPQSLLQKQFISLAQSNQNCTQHI